MDTATPATAHPFLSGGGEMGERTRQHDWSQTSVGDPGTWPQSLRTTVSNLLRSRFPMFLWWGPEMIQFYNDAYRPSLGNNGKHPTALGQCGPDCWPEIWPTIYPLIESVRQSGEPVFLEDQLIPIHRNGALEDVYWTFSYSSVLNDEGRHAGILVTCMETTAAVQGRIALEESELRYRNLIDQAPVAMAITRGDDFVFEGINAPMLRIIHRAQPNEVLGRPLADVLPELVHQPVFGILREVLRTGVTFTGTEVEAELLHNGVPERRYFSLTYSRVLADDGEASVLHMAADVTAQVLHRRKAEEGEAKLRSILNSAPTAICVFAGPDLIVENPNALMIEVLAAGPGIEGQSFRKLLSGLVANDQTFLGLIDTVRASGEPFEAQEVGVYFKAEQRTRYFNINFIPLRDESGAVYAVLDVSVDVTTQVLARQQLAASEAKFRSLIEEAPFATALYLGPEMVIDTVNEAMLRLWDKPPSVAGKTFAQALPELEGQPFPELLRRVYDTGVEHVARGVAADIVKDGRLERGWYNFNYKPVRNGRGEVYGIVHMAVDVTAQVRAQQKVEEQQAALSTALEQVRLSKEAAGLGTFDMDLEAGTMHWDERCRTFFGISHQHPVTYEGDFVNGLHPDDRDRILALIERLFDASVSNGDYDVEYRTVGAEDGVLRWVRAKGKVYFNQKGKPVRFIGSVLDITEKMMAIQQIEALVDVRTRELAQANDSLQRSNTELQRSNQNLEEFAHAASHDLKEPVRKIHFYTSQLKGQLSSHLKEAEARSFERIEKSTQRMRDLIDDLLLYSHASQRPLETEEVDLNQKIANVLEELELEIAEKGARIEVDPLPRVWGYRRQLQQLFQNLVSNALKYSKPGVAPHIRISAGTAGEAGLRYHRITVEDNGIGFDQLYADKVFQMFARLHGKNEYSGTGVGLSIVKKVVENHGGLIRVQSAPGKGSAFSVLLPER
ncbi:MAG: PAS domain S-box protein [Chitinophagaceae bacterium]|nr:MAG: PAS domain S-box protein [Chitinophagaceae bacterium]